jgi:hypothetical protein
MTEIDYAALVIKAFVHEIDHPAEILSAAWQRAFRARAAFEAAWGATSLEPPVLRRWLRSYRTALNSVTSACTTLENSLPTHPSSALHGEFIAAVDDYVEALRGAPPSPAVPWSLDTAELSTALRRVHNVASTLSADNGAARILIGELNTITRSLQEIAIDRVEPARRDALAARPFRQDEHPFGLGGDSFGIGNMARGKGFDAIGAGDPPLGVQIAQRGGPQITDGQGPGEPRTIGVAGSHLPQHVIEHHRHHAAVHVAGRTFIGRAEVEVGSDPAVGVLDHHKRRGDRIADADRRVAPRHPVTVGREAHTERTVDLFGLQARGRVVDLGSYRGDLIGIHLRADRGIDERTHRVGQR